jgi:hypothetical protein
MIVSVSRHVLFVSNQEIFDTIVYAPYCLKPPVSVSRDSHRLEYKSQLRHEVHPLIIINHIFPVNNS